MFQINQSLLKHLYEMKTLTEKYTLYEVQTRSFLSDHELAVCHFERKGEGAENNILYQIVFSNNNEP